MLHHSVCGVGLSKLYMVYIVCSSLISLVRPWISSHLCLAKMMTRRRRRREPKGVVVARKEQSRRCCMAWIVWRSSWGNIGRRIFLSHASELVTCLCTPSSSNICLVTANIYTWLLFFWSPNRMASMVDEDYDDDGGARIEPSDVLRIQVSKGKAQQTLSQCAGEILMFWSNFMPRIPPT